MTAAPTEASMNALVANVQLDRIHFHPRNIRKDLGDCRELAESIAIHGLLQPIRAERRGDHLRLLAGHRRVAAARLAGLKKVPCVIVDEHTDDAAICVMLTENLNRSGLTPEDKRDAVRTLREEFKLSAREIAERLGVSQVTVYNWAKPDEPPARNGRPAPAGKPGKPSLKPPPPIVPAGHKPMPFPLPKPTELRTWLLNSNQYRPAPLPGICARCGEVFLTGEAITRDGLMGPVRAECCALISRTAK